MAKSPDSEEIKLVELADKMLENAKSHFNRFEMSEEEIDELHKNVLKYDKINDKETKKNNHFAFIFDNLFSGIQKLFGLTYGFSFTPQLITTCIIAIFSLSYVIYILIPENKQNEIADLSKQSMYEKGYNRHQEREIKPEDNRFGKPGLTEAQYDSIASKDNARTNNLIIAKIDLNEEAYQPQAFGIIGTKGNEIYNAFNKIKQVLIDNDFLIMSESKKVIVTEWKNISINGNIEETRLKVTADIHKNLLVFYIEKRYKDKDDRLIQSKNFYEALFDKINESLKK